MSYSDEDDDIDLFSSKVKRLQAYARALRAEGASEEAIKHEIDQLEAEIDAQPLPEDTAGRTPVEIAQANLVRAHSGLPELPGGHLIAVTDRDGKRKYVEPVPAKLSSADLAGRKIERAIRGNEETLAGRRVAPKGLSGARLAQENLRRACSGEAPLLPHGESEED